MASLSFIEGDLLETYSDELQYLHHDQFGPMFEVCPEGELQVQPGDIKSGNTYLCIGSSTVFPREYKKMVKILTPNGPRWCFASCFKRR